MISTRIATASYENPPVIQTRVIPHILDVFEVMGIAAAGIGKTTAFVLQIFY